MTSPVLSPDTRFIVQHDATGNSRLALPLVPISRKTPAHRISARERNVLLRTVTRYYISCSGAIRNATSQSHPPGDERHTSPVRRSVDEYGTWARRLP